MGAWGGREPGADGSMGRMGAWGGREPWVDPLTGGVFSPLWPLHYCGSPYLAYWNWPFSAGSMPRFPSSAGAENGCNRRVYLIGEGSYRSGTRNSKPRFERLRGPRRQPRRPPGRRIPRQAAGDIGPNRRGRLGPTDPQWPLPYPAGLWALTRALFRRGGAHAWCGTHVWSWLHPSWRSRPHI